MKLQQQIFDFLISSLMVRWVVGSILHGAADPLSYFSFQTVLHDWCKAVVCAILSVEWCI